MLVDVCMYLVCSRFGGRMERKAFFSYLFCFKLIFVFLLTLPDPPRINVDGMICT